MTTYLVLDVPNLCHRAYHTTGGLSHGLTPTGVLYGFFREVFSLIERFKTNKLVFCFEGSGKGIRETLYPTYKASRRARKFDPEEAESRRDLYQQIDALRDTILWELGYRNIFHASGYEADDAIASFCRGLSGSKKAIIVGSDHDLYQCLDKDRITVWHPAQKKLVTEGDLWEKYYVTPDGWATVKAIAGDDVDEVTGVPGIGEITAAKFTSGRLGEKTKAFQLIDKIDPELMRKNLKLVRLPLKGCPWFNPVPDAVSKSRWREVLNRLGMRSLTRDLAEVEID